MFVPSNAIPPGSMPTAKVPSFAPVGDSSVTPLLSESTTHMFVPSNAIPVGPMPTLKKMEPNGSVGESSVTTLPVLVTHMFVPSNAIPSGLLLTPKEPRAPHVGGVAGLQAKSFLQAPASRDATGARGARQRWAAGGQTLQGPVAQSLSSLHAPPGGTEPPST